jgi:hypothetical protein
MSTQEISAIGMQILNSKDGKLHFYSILHIYTSWLKRYAYREESLQFSFFFPYINLIELSFHESRSN